jgi:hypothetical protein
MRYGVDEGKKSPKGEVTVSVYTSIYIVGGRYAIPISIAALKYINNSFYP